MHTASGNVFVALRETCFSVVQLGSGPLIPVNFKFFADLESKSFTAHSEGYENDLGTTDMARCRGFFRKQCRFCKSILSSLTDYPPSPSTVSREYVTSQKDSRTGCLRCLYPNYTYIAAATAPTSTTAISARIVPAAPLA
jgi:hypothetical protein